MAKETGRVRLGYPFPPLVHNEDVADLKPPKARNNRFFGSDSGQSRIGMRMFLVLKCPAGCNRCIEHEWH
jgi:hypothetical protein